MSPLVPTYRKKKGVIVVSRTRSAEAKFKTGSKSDSSESGIGKGIKLGLNIVIKNQQTAAKVCLNELSLSAGERSQV